MVEATKARSGAVEMTAGTCQWLEGGVIRFLLPGQSIALPQWGSLAGDAGSMTATHTRPTRNPTLSSGFLFWPDRETDGNFSIPFPAGNLRL